ncbi:MAG: hypothetical protein CM15mP103_09130 [Gammaproteobacteria bacterium]|nr:MAG: hypothetical protein CM15mP103_09130 [Gammaproteobacteria bacterium]
MNAKQPLSQQGREAYSGQIKNFPKERYISTDWYAREWRAVWAKSWIAAVHVSDLTRPATMSSLIWAQRAFCSPVITQARCRPSTTSASTEACAWSMTTQVTGKTFAAPITAGAMAPMAT